MAENLVRELLQEALLGVIECPECGNQLEPDAEECFCGWQNILVKLGCI